MKICLFFLGFFSFFGFAQESEKKIYVEPEQMMSQEGRIWINCGQGWFCVKQIGTDPRGVYVLDPYYADPDSTPVGGWQCGYCPKINPLWTRKCLNSGCPTNKS